MKRRVMEDDVFSTAMPLWHESLTKSKNSRKSAVSILNEVNDNHY